MSLTRCKVVCSLLLFATLCGMPAFAQTISATLSGYVNDQTGAVIPGAQVTLLNQLSKDVRQTTSNSAGVFTFSAVPAGTYSVTIKYTGFDTFVEKDIELHPSDKRELTDIKMKIGAVTATVTVTSKANAIEATGERGALITAEDIKRLPVEGRDVTELIKTLPGFAQTAQGSSADNLGPDSEQVGGQTGNYTANGASAEGISIISDGVNITDPGNGSSSDQVINMDNVAEVKIQTSNFGADSAKGPIVINAVGKSGGSEYHGSAYVYGRTYQLNTQDWFSKHDNDAKPQDHYVYPGFNIGGPVKIPGTNFNHSKKLTFFLGGEDYAQRNVYAYGSAGSATVDALVPTANMRKGDFSLNELSNYFGVTDTLPPPANSPPGTDPGSCSPTGELQLYIHICNQPSGQTPGTYPAGSSTPVNVQSIVGGNIPQSAFDPNTTAILNHLIPLPNRPPSFSNPSNSATAGELSVFNYQQVNLLNNDSYQARARVDYAISDSSKIYFVYDFQHSNSRNPQQIFYSPQQPFGDIDYPGGILNNDFSHTAAVNFTQVLSPSETNEAYIGMNLNFGGNQRPFKGAGLASTIGYNQQGIYPQNPLQYPQLNDYGYDGLPLALFPDFSTPIYQHKFVPNVGDNFTKVVKVHTFKVGFYVERATNNQTDLNVASNGQIEQYYLGPDNAPGSISEPGSAGHSNISTPGNYLASFLLGEIQEYGQNNFQTNSDLYYWTTSMYATDSWKVNRQLTLDIGFRLEHVGPWQDAHGAGLAVWDPALYAKQVTVTDGDTITSAVTNPGYNWHGIDKSIPNSGTGSTLFFFSPRFGVAYDVYGDGKTFVRGGIGAYRSHDAWNDVNQEQATAQGQTYASVGGGGLLISDIPALVAAGSSNVASGQGASGITHAGFGLQRGDTEQPLTYTYSFTLSQQIGPNTLFETAYQGSQSSHLLTQYEQGASGDLENIDALPIGALYKPDPLTGFVGSPQTLSTDGLINDYRPYPFYSQVNVARHILYSNYNGLQTTIRRTQGRFQYNFNYTWSKNMGVLGSYGTGNVIDSGNIRPNYGPLATDRSHVINATYSYNVGDWKHGGKLVREIANGWELSQIFNLQSGPNIQRILGSNLGLGGQIEPNTGATPANMFSVNNLTFLGTPDVVLQPKLLCDPRTAINASKHQYLNPACFAIPDFGVNGPAEMPYIHGPAYFDTDARLGKGFKVGEKQDLQLQLSAFNVINRPNYSFSSKFPTEQELYFSGTTLQPGIPGQSPQTSSDFGSALFRFGRRVVEISMKYNF